MKVPLLDLKAQYDSIKPEIDAAIAEVIESQRFILGPQVKACEEAIAAYCGCAHAVGVSSGTDALLIALMAEGIGPGDEVITTSYSFFATAGCIARLGATPVFVDIDPVTYNIDPVKLHALLTKNHKQKTKNFRAILPVHLYGLMADMDPIMEIAKQHNLVVIEDAAQAIGAEYASRTSLKFEVSSLSFSDQRPETKDHKPAHPVSSLKSQVADQPKTSPDSVPELQTIDQKLKTTLRRAGAYGEYGCFSFFPSKNLGAFGDGGIVTTNDPERAEKLRVLRAHGSKPKYYHKLVGGNFRLDTLQAAIVLAKLKHLDDWTAKRQANAARYNALFNAAGLVAEGLVALPRVSGLESVVSGSHPTINQKLQTKNYFRHIYNQYVIRVPRRDELQAYLKEQGIGTEVYYPLPLHLQDCFACLGYKSGDLPESEKAAKETLALPVYPELSEEQAHYVVDTVRAFYTCEL